MTMTDPIADMLTRLRNANVAHHDTVRMPSSKLKEALAAILVREGYITSFKVTSDEKRPGSFLEVTMKYASDRTRTISGVRRVSKPGLRVYTGADKLPARPRRPGRCRAVYQPGPHERPGGPQTPCRWRDPLLRLVTPGAVGTDIASC